MDLTAVGPGGRRKRSSARTCSVECFHNAYRAARREQAIAYASAWRARNRERDRPLGRARQANRRARKKALFVETIDPLVVFERDDGTCQLCGEPVGDQTWHIDHRIPLAKNGEHSYANVQLAHARCNLSKGAKLVSA